MRQPKHAKKSVNGLFWPKGSDRNAHITDAPSCIERINCSVAHIFRFKPDMPPKPYDRKSLGRYPYCPALLFSEQGTKKYSPQPISARFDLCREAKKDPIGIFFACFG
jgi:hypothetical protein